MTWCPPALTLIWGAYFQPDADDDTKIVTLTAAALTAKIITKGTAVRKCARTFGIENPDAYLEGLEEEAQAALEQQQALLGAGEGAMHKMLLADDDDEGDAPASPAKKPKKTPPKTDK